MPPARRIPAALSGGPFTYSDGLRTVGRGHLRGPAYRRLTRGVYDDAAEALDYPAMITAMRLVVPHHAVLAGLSAARAHGVQSARPGDPVEFICLPGELRRRSGLILRSDRLAAGDVVMTRFGPATSPAQTAFDLARAAALPRAAARGLLTRLAGDVRLAPAPPRGPALFGFPNLRALDGETPMTVAGRLVVAVSRVDAVLRAAKLGAPALGEQISRHPGARGVWSARAVRALTDPRAESPPESVLRARVVLAGLPRPEPQYEIFDANGVFVARPDLGWEEFELGGEYDGAYHDERTQIRRDRKRDVAGHRVRWRLVHFDSSDLRNVPQLIRDLHTIMLQQRSRD